MKNTCVILFLACFAYCAAAYSTAPYHWTKTDARFDSIAGICESCLYHDFPRKNVRGEIAQLSALARRHPHNRQLTARALYWEAWEKYRYDIAAADSLLSLAFTYGDSAAFPYDHARMNFLKGDIQRTNGEWASAYRIYKQQEAFFTEHHHTFDAAKVAVATGTILQELGEPEEALKYYRKGDELFGKTGNINCQTKNRINISNILYMLGNKQDALHILKELEQNPIARSDTGYMVNVLISLYTVSDKQEKDCPQRAYDLVRERQYKPLMTLTLYTMGINYLTCNRPDSALHYFRKGLDSAFENHDVYKIVPLLSILSETFGEVNETDSAYRYMRLANTYRDSLLNQEKIIELNKLESRAVIEKYEADLKQAREKAIYQKRITWISVSAIVILSCLIFYILWLSKRREAMGKQLKEAENRELLLLNKQYLLELDSKNRELTSNTLIIAKKNTLLKELSQQIEALENKGAINSHDGVQLKSHIKSEILADDEWQYFKLHFDKVHPDFFLKLKELHPNLSETELRLCAYIRIGMSAKEIAQMLSIQPETVNTSRYRIRKKVKLASGESLEDYLRSL